MKINARYILQMPSFCLAALLPKYRSLHATTKLQSICGFHTSTLENSEKSPPAVNRLLVLLVDQAYFCRCGLIELLIANGMNVAQPFQLSRKQNS